MKDYKSENKTLKQELSKALKKIKWYESPLFIFEMVENLTGTYSVLLYPPSVKIKSTLKQKSCSFNVNVGDVICILSDERTKYIYLKTIQKSFEGVLNETNKIIVNETVDKICRRLDSSCFHLVKVSPSAAVNIAYYDLDKKHLKINFKGYKPINCNRISITDSFIDNFKVQKAAFDHVKELQKKLNAYK